MMSQKRTVAMIVLIISIGFSVGLLPCIVPDYGVSTNLSVHTPVVSTGNETYPATSLYIVNGEITNGTVTNLTKVDLSYLTIQSEKNSTTSPNNASDILITTGIVSAGNVTNTHIVDSSPHTIREGKIGGINQMDFRYSFSSDGRPTRYCAYVYSLSAAPEDFNIYIYNWTRSDWDFLVQMTAHLSYTWFNVTLGFTTSDWTNGSAILIRYTDTISDTATGDQDLLNIDYQYVETVRDDFTINYGVITQIPQSKSKVSHLAVNYTGMCSDLFNDFSLSVLNTTSGGFDLIGSINSLTSLSIYQSIDPYHYLNTTSHVVVQLNGSLRTHIYYPNISHYNDFIQFVYYDAPPQYSNIIHTLNNSYQVGKVFSFNATWIDNIQIDTVTFRLNSTNYTTQGTGSDYTINFTLNIGIYIYQWFANDTYGGANATPAFIYQVVENSSPIITDVSIDTPLDTPQYFEPVTIGGNVTDLESGIKNVTIHYGIGSPTSNAVMTDLDGDGRYTGTIPSYLTGSTVLYYVSAIDWYDNIATSTTYQYTVVDRTPPNISGIVQTPDTTVSVFDVVIISTNISDVGTVDTVLLEITENGTSYNTTMLGIFGTYYGFIPPLSNATLVEYTIIANDSYGNVISSPTLSYRTNLILSVQVTDNHGETIENATIQLLNGDIPVNQTASNGTVTIYDVSTGNYTLTISQNGYFPYSNTFELKGDTELSPSISIENHTVDLGVYKSWDPLTLIDDVQVTFTNAIYGNSFTTTLPSGWGILEIENGTYLVTLEKIDYVTENYLIHITSNYSNTFYLENNEPTVSTNIYPDQTFSDNIPVIVSANDPNGIAHVQFYFNDLLIYDDVDGWDGWSCTIDITQLPNDFSTIRIYVFDTEGSVTETTIPVYVQNVVIGSILTIILSVILSVWGVIVIIVGTIAGIAIAFYHNRKKVFIATAGISSGIGGGVALITYLVTHQLLPCTQILAGLLLFLITLSIGIGIGFISRRTVVQNYLQKAQKQCKTSPDTLGCRYLFGKDVPNTIVVYRSTPHIPAYVPKQIIQKKHNRKRGIL